MRLPRLIVAALLGAVLVLMFPGVATAATTYTDSVSGYEVYATSTRGTFTGRATGALPGYWGATVDHKVLSPSGDVTGGSFYLATSLNGTATLITGRVGDGEVTRLNPSATGCVNQYYDVNLVLTHVSAGATASGTGEFDGTLTHRRTSVFGRCVTYAATITGSLTLSL